jgi:chromosome segregation ATPase
MSDWHEAHENLSVALSQMANEVSTTARGTSLSSRQLRNFNKQLQRHGKAIQDLQRSLHENQSRLGNGEISRRQAMLGQLNKLQATVQNTIKSSSAAGAVSRMTNDQRRYQETEFTQNQSQQQILKAQESQLKDQDAKLDLMQEGLTQIEGLSRDMGKELGLQARLLDDIDRKHDKLDTKLEINVDGVDHLQEESGSCGSLICIFILFLVIVLVAATDITCPFWSALGGNKC